MYLLYNYAVKIKKILSSQAVAFVIIGLMTLGIDIAMTTIMYHVFNLPAYLSGAIGFMSGFFFNFPMNRKRVFNHTDKDRFSLRVQIALYASLSLFNLGATSACLEVLVSHLSANISAAKVFVTAVFAVWNFLVFKFFIFSKSENTPLPVDA